MLFNILCRSRLLQCSFFNLICITIFFSQYQISIQEWREIHNCKSMKLVRTGQLAIWNGRWRSTLIKDQSRPKFKPWQGYKDVLFNWSQFRASDDNSVHGCSFHGRIHMKALLSLMSNEIFNSVVFKIAYRYIETVFYRACQRTLRKIIKYEFSLCCLQRTHHTIGILIRL